MTGSVPRQEANFRINVLGSLECWSGTRRIHLRRFEGQEEVTKTVIKRHREFGEYLQQFIDERRRRPREDLLSGLVHAEARTTATGPARTTTARSSRRRTGSPTS